MIYVEEENNRGVNLTIYMVTGENETFIGFVLKIYNANLDGLQLVSSPFLFPYVVFNYTLIVLAW